MHTQLALKPPRVGGRANNVLSPMSLKIRNNLEQLSMVLDSIEKTTKEPVV